MSPRTAVALGAIPASCMLLFTFLGLNRRVPPTVAGALQHFAAGILLCTIGTELLPAMANASGWGENLASGLGFFLGVALLIVLGIVLPGTDEGSEDGDGDENAEVEKRTPPNADTPPRTDLTYRESLHRRRVSLKAAAYNISITCAEKDFSPEMSGVSEFEESPLLPLETAAASPNSKPFPSALVIAIAIDSILDGLLIGIAVAAGPSAGPMMSASLTVEMSFLGLTLATALHGFAPHLSLPAAFLGPAAILMGAAAGGMLALTLGDDPVLLVGMLSFGTSALLFMVAEELLLEAHEDGDHCWWVDLQLYIGFFVSIMAGKLVPSA